MDYDEYLRLAMVTCGQTDMREILQMSALGLAGESGEVTDLIKKYVFHGHPLDVAKVTKEAGDVMWYIASTCHGSLLSLQYVMDSITTQYRPSGIIFDAFELSKAVGLAVTAIRGILDTGYSASQAGLDRRLGNVVFPLRRILQEINVSMEDVLQTNIDKLMVRYPLGFSTERSIHRGIESP